MSGQRDLDTHISESEPAPGTADTNDHADNAVLAAAMVQLAQSNTIDVPLPGTLERIVVHTQSDTIYDLPDGSAGLRANQSDGSLLLGFPNGGVVEFTGFAASTGVEFHTADKGTLDAGNFLTDLHDHESGAPVPPDNPLFTPGPGPEILGGLTPTGALGPSDLTFPHVPGIEHVSFLHPDEGIFPAPENNEPPVAPSGVLFLGKDGSDPNANPDVNGVEQFGWSQITNGGQSIDLPSDPDGDPITIKIVSLPAEISNSNGGDSRIDLFVDDGGTKVPLHAGDVLTTSQLQNNLFSWVARAGSSPAQLGDLVYSVTDTHMHTVQGIISINLNGTEQ